jgi:hypothetical protein
MRLAVPLEEVWEGLLFYEQIAERPSIHLRLLLPSPIRTEGRKAEVGDEARCLYDAGHLVKRVTRVERPWIYGFRIVEQDLDVGRGLRLSGGRYTLSESPQGGTEIALETRYESPHRPRWLWQPIESAICHAFHRHILGAMRRSFESREGRDVP